MIRIQLMVPALIAGTYSVVPNPVARADDSVTYEVVSDVVPMATVEYFDHSERKVLTDVPLPWRTNATVLDARSASTDGAEVRADWRPAACDARYWCPEARPNRWVTVRIYFQGTVLCQNTLDVGNSACYGSTTFKN